MRKRRLKFTEDTTPDPTKCRCDKPIVCKDDTRKDPFTTCIKCGRCPR